MKKVFLSVPVKGRKKEDIESSIAKMKAVASAYLSGEELTFITNAYIEDDAPGFLNENSNNIWNLGTALQCLAQCEIVVGIDGYWDFPDCTTFSNVAHEYGIQYTSLDTAFVAPDIWKRERYGDSDGDEQTPGKEEVKEELGDND